MSDKLAVFGGDPTITLPLAPIKTVGDDEVAAATRVIRSGVLSGYVGAKVSAFLGGPEVRAFEEKAAEYFGVKYAIAVNSWTSGLIAAVGAIGIEPGDEIITTPWTMAASATAILHFNGIPIFADIDPLTFNISPDAVEKLVTKRTKAIIAVDIFGQSADISALKRIAEKYGIRLISDTAQAPGALYFGSNAGTLADIGGFSLNYHKHVHCGEGGILVTNSSNFAERLRLLRNHAEAVIDSDDHEQLNNMIGFNFRMGEIEAAIASVQLDKLNDRIASRQEVAYQLNQGLANLKGLKLPLVSDSCSHVYYIYGLIVDTKLLGVSRDKIIHALEAEGVMGLMAGYQNLHLLSIFKNKIAYGSNGFPWTSPYCTSNVKYEVGLCPVAEELHSTTFMGLLLCMYQYTPTEVSLIIKSFQKVWQNIDKL